LVSTTVRILDLFSGIGGFSLGLERASKEFQTVAFCEQDPFCTRILNKHWPDVPVYPDIRKLNGEKIKELAGAIDIVCGGFPCQPFSQAGKRRGKADDRDLWPEMFRIIKECVPAYVIGENVAGFVNMELDRTVSDLESENYEVRVFVLGAVSVQAPHQRQRCWIIGRKRDVENSGGTRTGVTLGTISDQGRGTSEGRAESIRQGHGKAGTNRTATTSQDGPHSHGQGEPNGSKHEEWLQRDVGDPKHNGSSAAGDFGGIQGELDRSKKKIKQSTGTSGLPGTESDVADSGGTGSQGHGQKYQLRKSGQKTQVGRGSKDVADSEGIGHRGGNRKKRGAQQRELQPEEQEGSPVRGEAQGCGGSFPKDVADSISQRGCGRETGGEDAENVRQPSGGEGSGERDSQCGMGDLADGLSAELLDIGSIWHIEPDIPRVAVGEKDRTKKLKALGNSVVPQIPEILGRLIMEVEKSEGSR
jgi:DNA-cytosine methyltransferase